MVGGGEGAGDEAFLMTSLVLILAMFLRRRRRFLSEDATNVSRNGEDATDCDNPDNPKHPLSP